MATCASSLTMNWMNFHAASFSASEEEANIMKSSPPSTLVELAVPLGSGTAPNSMPALVSALPRHGPSTSIAYVPEAQPSVSPIAPGSMVGPVSAFAA